MKLKSLFRPFAVGVIFVMLGLPGGCSRSAEQASQNAETNRGHDGDIAFGLPLAKDAPDSLKVHSANFTNNGSIPLEQTAYDKNISPALNWSGAPENTKTFALIVEDPDSVSPKPFVHWLVANIPASRSTLPANLPAGNVLKAIGGAQQGAGSGEKVGYFGPRPPAGSGLHHYHFQIFALDEKLDLPPGFDRQALLNAMKNHILAKGQVIGTFQRESA
jgi:Raf kinase inhibitor-like YbhB/YbcL family protein